jgi:hypothetical protein
MLISAARLIVMECTVLAPGVLEELEIVVNRRRTARTVVVVPSARTVRDLESLRQFDGIMGATELAYAPFTSRDAAPLAPFERVIDDDAMLATDPADLAVFDGLLPGLSQG